MTITLDDIDIFLTNYNSILTENTLALHHYRGAMRNDLVQRVRAYRNGSHLQL